MNRLLKLIEAREILNVGRATMYKIVYHREQNKFPCLKVGGRWRVPEDDLNEWIKALASKKTKE